MIKSVFTLATICLLSGCIVYLGNDNFDDLLHKEERLTLDASTLNQLRADTGAGSLDILGEEGRTTIELVADIYYNDMDDIVLRLEADGNAAKLVAETIENRYRNHNNYAHIDLFIRVPANFSLNLNDGSGKINIQNLNGDVVVVDGSGSLEINGGANVVVEDGSGELTIKNVQGNVNVTDGSGALSVYSTKGLVTITDGSGKITVEDAGGLNIINSGSGGLTVSHIDGPVSVDEKKR